jgi:hypothetical protein
MSPEDDELKKACAAIAASYNNDLAHENRMREIFVIPYIIGASLAGFCLSEMWWPSPNWDLFTKCMTTAILVMFILLNGVAMILVRKYFNDRTQRILGSRQLVMDWRNQH